MHDRLVVGFDGSATSVSAVRWAVGEADWRTATLRIVSSYAVPPVMDVYGIGGGYPSPADLPRATESAEAAVDTIVTACRGLHPGVIVDGAAIDTPIVAELLDEAGRADLVVVGRSGTGRFEHLFLGSVTQAVLHRSPCPVAVVPTTVAEAVGRVVVGIDGSPSADIALRWAAAEADLRRAELVVLHAWDYPYRKTAEGVAPGADLARVDAALVLDRAVEAARDVTAGDVTARLVDGVTVQALLDAGENADLIVVGSRGRGGFRRMLLGSVAHAVSGHAPCAVVVVR